ncbi:MAG TPA: TolC family protein [Verrucomicrobiales bacterium]|jgi:outer membrane protein TolC|nr:TolC family protein [Verrucomicrobiales bacterium]
MSSTGLSFPAVLAAAFLLANTVPAQSADPVPVSGPVFIGSLADLRERVLDANWAIQAKVMEYEVKRRTQEAAKGTFDPLLSASYNYEDSRRPNTVEERRQLSGVPLLAEKNHIGSTSLETLTPLGSRLSLTASVSELRNNLQQLTTGGFGATGEREVVTFVGVTLTQPLLKDAGKRIATAAIRVAASETEQAWQDFRRQLMVSLSSAELAYWNVYGATRQVEYSNQSVETARKMANDAKTMKEAGKAAPVELSTAEAGVEERLARVSTARQRLTEATALLAGFCGASVAEGFEVATTTPPPPNKVTPDVQSGLAKAYSANPDYLGKLAEKEGEDVRTEFMKNQKLPQLDLKASYGLNGLGTDLTRSTEDITGTDFAAWGVGIEFKMPLGNREAKNRYAAALAKQKSVETSVSDVRMQIGNAVDNAVQKVITSREALASYYRSIALNQEVLNSRQVDLKEGKSDVRRVLEAEEDLSQAKLAAVSGLILFRQAMLEYELATGQVLENRGISITKDDIAKKTALLAKGKKISPEQYEEYLGAVRDSFRGK